MPPPRRHPRRRPARARRPRRNAGTVPRGPSLGRIVSFRQHAYTVTTSQAATDVFSAANFVLSSASNYTGFTDLWDVYRVDYLEFTFTPTFTANPMGLAAVVPRIFVVIDLDDTVTPTTINQLREYQSCRTGVYETFKIRFRPGVLTGLFDGTNVIAGTHTMSPWIDCAKISIPHYGIKWGITANPTSGATTFQTWNIDLVVGLSFKLVR